MTTARRRRDLERTCAKAIPALADLAGMIGDPAVRHRGTIGGSIANNDLRGTIRRPVLALGATVETNKRSVIAADDFFRVCCFDGARRRRDHYRSVVPDSGQGGAIPSFPIPPRASRCTGVFVAKTKSGDVRVAAHRRLARRRHAGAGDRGGAEGQLVGRRAPDGVTTSADGPADAIFTAHRTISANLIKVMAQRAVDRRRLIAYSTSKPCQRRAAMRAAPRIWSYSDQLALATLPAKARQFS